MADKFAWLMEKEYLGLPFDTRVLEPEVMEETAEDYAGMDFSESNRAFVEFMLPFIPPNSCVADFGCGPGDMCVMLARKRPDVRVIGIDLSTSMLEIAAKKSECYALSNVEWRVGDMTQPLFQRGELDFAFSHTTLHHLLDTHPFFVQIANALRRGGGFCIQDLRRPASATEALRWITEAVQGRSLTQRQFELFFHSLRASFTVDEIKEQIAGSGLEGELVVPANPSRYWRFDSSERNSFSCNQIL